MVRYLSLNERKKISRYTVTLTKGTKIDPGATIGYDPPLRTFFLQAFPDSETDECALWLGMLLEEFPTMESIVAASRAEGYEITGLTQEATIAMLKESSKQTPPSVGEQLGIVR